MAYEIYDMIVELQRLVTRNESKFTPEELEQLRTTLNRACGIAGGAKA